MRSLVLVPLLLLGRSAGAAEATLETVRAQVADLQFPAAARSLAQLGQTDGLSRADALEFFTLQGLVQGALNDAEGAKKAFIQALSIDPEVKLPGRVAPRVSTPFLEAKAWVREHGAFWLAPPAQRRGGEGWELEFKPPKDDGALIDAVAFGLTEDGVRREVRVVPRNLGTLAVNGLQVTVTWRLLGAHGWVLHEGGPFSLEQARPPPAVTAPRPAPAALVDTAPAPRRMSKAPGIVLISVGGAVALTSLLFFSSASSSAARARAAPTLDELRSALASGKSSQTIGAVFLAGGAAAVAGGVALLVVSLVGPTPSPQLTFAPLAGGGVAVFSGSF